MDFYQNIFDDVDMDPLIGGHSNQECHHTSPIVSINVNLEWDLNIWGQDLDDEELGLSTDSMKMVPQSRNFQELTPVNEAYDLEEANPATSSPATSSPATSAQSDPLDPEGKKLTFGTQPGLEQVPSAPVPSAAVPSAAVPSAAVPSAATELHTIGVVTDPQAQKRAEHLQIQQEGERHAQLAVVYEAQQRSKLQPPSSDGSQTVSGAQYSGAQYSGAKGFTCEECGMNCTCKSALERHMLTHSGERPFKCNQCDRAFKSSNQLKVHIRTHSGEKPFKCNQCDKAFAESSNLTKHKKIHTGEKLFGCTQCGKVFSQNSNLKVHIRDHTGERPFKCNQCDRAFKSSSTLTSHKKSRHTVSAV